MKTLLEVLQSGAAYLDGRNVEHSRLIMEQLMSHVLECPRLQLYVRFETLLAEADLIRLRNGIKRLAAGEPLQYVLGDAEFMGHRFKTDKRALIPRPDTEALVEQVLGCQPLWGREQPVIADIGTGSGCVVISLAKARPQARYMAVDASEVAIELARENAELNGVGAVIEFKQGSLLEGVAPGSMDAVVANLPYIPTADCGILPRHIREHEPLSALDGGVDGLELVRKLAEQAKGILKSRGWIFLEIGYDQGGIVVEWLIRLGYNGPRVIKDLGNRDRVVLACC